MAAHPGWPAVLAEGAVGLRPLRLRDARAWSEIRLANEVWLAPWEPTSAASWRERNAAAAFPGLLRALRAQARGGQALPFAVTYNGALAGQLTIGNIVRGAFQSGYVGYWIDGRLAGRGIVPTALALAVDHAFKAAGMHRVEINIRPENVASRRVVEKLQIREEGMHPRYLHIDGGWRDHLGYAITAEEVAPHGLLYRWRSLQAERNVR